MNFINLIIITNMRVRVLFIMQKYEFLTANISFESFSNVIYRIDNIGSDTYFIEEIIEENLSINRIASYSK